jgi:hypothetical protein
VTVISSGRARSCITKVISGASEVDICGSVTILSLSIAHRVRQGATVDAVSSHILRAAHLRFCVRRQSGASLKTNTGTVRTGTCVARGPLPNPITCERTDAACHFAPTAITLDTRIAHSQRKVHISSRGKHVPVGAVEGHRRQGLVPWLPTVDLASSKMRLKIFADMRERPPEVALSMCSLLPRLSKAGSDHLQTRPSAMTTGQELWFGGH